VRNSRSSNSQLSMRTIAQRFGWLGGRVLLGSLVLGVGMSGASCAKAQARTTADGPPLEMPAPPARVIAPVDEPIASSPSEPAEPAPAPPSTNRRPARRPSPSEGTQKPEVPAAAPAEPAVPQAVPTDGRPVEPPPTLRAPGSAEKPIRDRLTLAQSNLSRVDYTKLSNDGRSQYEQSKRFIQQAEQALKDQNFVFAQTLADKAAQIATELLGR
jgi:type IV secretory pathway VirB10-like protein